MEKRRQAIVDLVNQMGEVNMVQLKEMFPSVSEVTLRKDLRCLDEAKKLVRVHAGAKSIQDIAGYGNNFAMRELLNQEEKVIIGEKAAALIQENTSVFISSGTTCVEVAKRLPQKPLYLFTDGIMVALGVSPCPEIRVEVLGGDLNRNLMRLSGPTVMNTLEDLRFDYAMIGTPGFHPAYGFSCVNAMIAATMNKVIERAEKVVMLLDSSKVNYIHTPRNIPLQSVDIVVSDGKLPPEIMEVMQKSGITVL